jgi:hypothetical protein
MRYALGWLAGFLYGQWLELFVVGPEAYKVAFGRARALAGPPDRQEQDLVSGVAILRYANKLGQAEDTSLGRWKFQMALELAVCHLAKAGWSQKRIEQKIMLEIDFGEEEA